MKHVSTVLGGIVSEPTEPLSDDAREAIREGLSLASLWGAAPNLTGGESTAEYLDRIRREQEGSQDSDDEPGLPLGWEGVEPVV